jgi:hypothetical protein
MVPPAYGPVFIVTEAVKSPARESAPVGGILPVPDVFPLFGLPMIVSSFGVALCV